MLTHLSIRDFTLVESLDLELQAGMTAITGETGAGKSIVLDALGLALGDRGDPDRIRQGAARADIHATFDISAIAAASQWLQTHELDAGSDCILRRTLTSEGRSRAFINGHPATLQQLRELGELLIDIHSQHAHQSLLKKDNHRRLLDDFGQLQALAAETAQQFQRWQKAHKAWCQTRENADEISARQQLLSYQVGELDALSLQADEIAGLEAEQRTLDNAGEILQGGQQLAELCNSEEHGLRDLLGRATRLLSQLPGKTPALQEAEQLLLSAEAQIEEASRAIDHHLDHFEVDPVRQREVAERLTTIYEIARKHRIQPDELPGLHQQLQGELSLLTHGDASLEELEQQATSSRQRFAQLAASLSEQRQQAARRLAADINQQLQLLSMKTAHIEIACQPTPDKPTAHGIDDIEFLISTNPGQPPRPLAKVASGGELSRVSLAIQVVTAQNSTIPTLVFDEVDVGIGGATGDIVGQLLRQLGSQGQVLCVTHLAQVASKGHHHLQVHKHSDQTTAQTTLTPLLGEERITEIARMMSGTTITEQSLAHAREMTQALLH
jgi:DNA repair protein RecN (Recombination protein N)